jgi:hypothetical protein
MYNMEYLATMERKVTPVYSVTGCGRVEVRRHGTRWHLVVSFMPQPLDPRGKSLRYTFNMRLCGAPRQSGHFEEEKNFNKVFSGYQMRHVVEWPVNQSFNDHLCGDSKPPGKHTV